MNDNTGKIIIPRQEHQDIFLDVVKLLDAYSSLSRIDMLAIFSNVLGKLIALQDQSTISPEMAMEIVIKNIEIGNKETLEQLLNTQGNA